MTDAPSRGVSQVTQMQWVRATSAFETCIGKLLTNRRDPLLICVIGDMSRSQNLFLGRPSLHSTIGDNQEVNSFKESHSVIDAWPKIRFNAKSAR